MSLYAITYTHSDAEGWQRHLAAHIAWLRARVAGGALRPSMPQVQAQLALREREAMMDSYRMAHAAPEGSD